MIEKSRLKLIYKNIEPLEKIGKISITSELSVLYQFYQDKLTIFNIKDNTQLFKRTLVSGNITNCFTIIINSINALVYWNTTNIYISSIYIDDDNVLQMYSKHLPLSKLASLTNKDLNGDQINNVVLNKDNKKLIVVLNKDVYICDYDGLISEDNDTDLLLDSNSIKILEPPNTQTSSFLVNVKAFTYQNTETMRVELRYT